MVAQKGTRKLGVLLAVLLLFIQILFQFKWLNLILIVLIVLLISVAFFKEKYRVFIWCIISFTMGLFALVYIDRILIETSLTRPELLIVNRLLLLIPIMLMSYILLKFKEVQIKYLKIPDWESTTKLLSRFQVKNVFWIVTVIHLIALLVAIVNVRPISRIDFFYAVVFSIISGTLTEILWRGILLSRMEPILGEKLAILFTSTSSSLAMFLFGFTVPYSLLFFFMGLFLGIITCQTKSIYPAIILSIALQFFLVLQHVIPLMTQ